MFRPYFYAACGAVGFGLSFLTGLFSGAGFALILVRALVFAALFAGLSLAFHLLLKRFVPDLFEGDSAAPAAEAADSESSLDITIGDNESDQGDSSVPDFMKGGENEKDEMLEESKEAVPHSESTLSEAEKQEMPDFYSPAKPSSNEDEYIDVLPDMQAEAAPARSAGRTSSAAGSSQGLAPAFSAASSNSDDLFGSDAGGETIARAIRTVLSRE